MAQFYVVNVVRFAGGVLLPGTLLDSVVDPTSYNAAVNAGALLIPSSDTAVATAAAAAAKAKRKGANEQELQAIMMSGIEKAQGADSGAAGGIAADVSIADAGGLITATDVEGALQEIANGALTLFKRTVNLLHGAVTATPDNVATAFTANIGAVLPANAVVLAHEVLVTTLFSGGGLTAAKLDVGGTTTTAIVNQQDVFTGAATGKTSVNTGSHERGKFSAEQLVATLTPDAGHKTSQATAGDVTITVWYSVLA